MLMNKKLLMCLLTLLLCVSAAVAQTKITGTVVSFGDNEPRYWCYYHSGGH